METSRKLVKKRGQIKAQLTRFNNFLNGYDESKYSELHMRFQRMEMLLLEFNEVQLELELLDDEADHELERETFETQYYTILSVAQEKMAVRTNETHHRQSDGGNNNRANDTLNNAMYNFAYNNTKLPSIALPKFKGEYDKWTQFIETFQTLVHNNHTLDNIQKFYHLLTCLEGDAKRVLECLEVTRDNYLVALELLEKRFKNKPVIIQTHLNALVEIPVITKESAYLLRNLNENVEKHLRALKALGEPTEMWDRLIIFLMGRKLDVETRKEWEEKMITEFKGEPNLNNFTDFLRNKAIILETVGTNIKNGNWKGTSKRTSYEKGSYVLTEDPTTLTCGMCKGTHHVYRCEKLLALSVNDRIIEIKRMKLCLNCLRSGHYSYNCRSYGCKKCHRKHNTMIHIENLSDGKLNDNNQTKNANNSGRNNVNACTNLPDEGSNESAISAMASNSPRAASQVILSTAIVEIRGSDNKFIKCRALLDSGSQMNFISKNMSEKLNLTKLKINLPVSGVSQMTTHIKYQTRTCIKSAYNNFNVELSFLILENITAHIPSRSFNATHLNIPRDLKLADPEFNVSSPIDILIGAGLFFELMCAGQIKLGTQLPILQKSLLGWIVAGPTLLKIPEIQYDNTVCNVTVDVSLQTQLEKFWAIEECNDNKVFYSKEERECEETFIETVRRDETGRFCVTLPTRNKIGELGDSLDAATNRFYALERRLAKNQLLKNNYYDFLNEYRELGHMTKIKENERETTNNVYYLPHHGVLNEASSTTKLRVVFDGSAKTASGISLNDVLKVGPNIQDELFNILLRFREYNVVVTADIAKMYRQINIVPAQRDLQRILWRAKPEDELEHYRLNTVTYGTAPAAFLATRCLRQVANEVESYSTRLRDIIVKNFYVDDLITGTQTVNQAIELVRDISNLLDQYGFPLRKWASNEVEVIRQVATKETDGEGYFITDIADSKKTLGVFWKAGPDLLEYMVRNNVTSRCGVTKRHILSITSQIFDPLGLVGPVTIRAKVLLQKLWLLKLEWDETIPLDLFTCWNEFYGDLKALNEIKIPRQCTRKDSNQFELHGFCDASEIAYGACIYMRTINKNGDVCVRLLCAKSRIAPLKSISIPRLELCGATLLARLIKKVSQALDAAIHSVRLWSDSTIVLSWLAEEPSKWKVFVANRIAEIQELTKSYQWSHVISVDNPADIISRGVKPSELGKLKLWWQGPNWLMQPPEDWPKCDIIKPDISAERRVPKLVFHNVINDETIFTRFSALYKLQRVIARCRRFFNNARRKSCDRNFDKLSVTELDEALHILLKVMQGQVFRKELSALQNGKNVHNKSSVRTLDPFLDKRGLLRVGGRLKNSNEPYDVKFPILLPQGHPLTKLIILNCHLKQLHAGTQAILCTLRQHYWPINGRNAVRSVLLKCVTCFRVKPLKVAQKMGNLPKDRVTPNRPFSICGVDYAGPFNVKDGKLRNRAVVKGYMCLFVCFVTRAVHIELASDLSTNTFLNCFKRFISRRGICTRIYSDNATNFLGAGNDLEKTKNLLKESTQDTEISEFCTRNSITWNYIPPRSPHQGGIWEAAIKSAKHHIKRIIGNVVLTYEDLYTIFTQVEAVLNSRPLTPLSNDPNDLSALTPGHFLIGDALTAPPQIDVSEGQFNRLDQFHKLQQMIQHFWSRWTHEYLATLQQRSKWQHAQPNQINIGTMVVLQDDNSATLNWKLGRVVALHTGNDNITRVVSVKTSVGVVKRAVQRLCILPIN